MSDAATAAEGSAAPRRRLHRPGTWPVRWRLAVASALLTLAILVVFAGVIGHLATSRVRSDFNRDLRTAVSALARKVKVTDTAEGLLVQGPDLPDFSLASGAAARVVSVDGHVLEQTRNVEDLGPVKPGITDIGSVHVATARVVSPHNSQTVAFVQYARSEEHVESTIERLWFFIGAGVLGGVLLASLAGLAIAGRAMRPISSLTATAREIATTRDPSRHMPQPGADDEVGELARTLEQMLRSLDAARSETEGAMQKQREFVADASHELRTPLTSVLANLELLQASLQTPAQSEGREMVDSALRSSRRMSRLVGDLLLLARADAGRVSERRDCDLAEIAGAAAAELAPFGAKHQLDIDNEVPIHIEGNPDELHRLVLNLLDNALQHTPPGSHIELRLASGDGKATIDVADDGPGLPVAEREHLFDRFVRGNGPADTAGGSGTGLGLAIVRAVASSHGGSVTASDSELGGARFHVSLPLAGTEQRVSGSLETL